MDITTFRNLKSETKVTEFDDGISVYVPSNWVLKGENRVSYTTIIRLVECCREFHWEKDIKAQDPILDSICGSINSEFTKSIACDTEISITYYVKEIQAKRYLLEFIVKDQDGDTCCSVNMTSYFYDPIKKKSIPIPNGILFI